MAVIIFLKSTTKKTNLYTSIVSYPVFCMCMFNFKLSAQYSWCLLARNIRRICVEFLGSDGKFDIESYVEEHNFTVNLLTIPTSNVGEWEIPNTQSNPGPVSSTHTSLRVTWRIALATLEAVQADLGSTDKSTNMNYHNLTAHIN